MMKTIKILFRDHHHRNRDLWEFFYYDYRPLPRSMTSYGGYGAKHEAGKHTYLLERNEMGRDIFRLAYLWLLVFNGDGAGGGSSCSHIGNHRGRNRRICGGWFDNLLCGYATYSCLSRRYSWL